MVSIGQAKRLRFPLSPSYGRWQVINARVSVDGRADLSGLEADVENSGFRPHRSVAGLGPNNLRALCAPACGCCRRRI
jgi:hypothetical protein